MGEYLLGEGWVRSAQSSVRRVRSHCHKITHKMSRQCCCCASKVYMGQSCGGVCGSVSAAWLKPGDPVSHMPNGHRVPYRVGDGAPSPLHSSDSDETWENKRRYWRLARRVAARFRRLVRRARRERNFAVVVVVRKHARNSTDVARRIVSFL